MPPILMVTLAAVVGVSLGLWLRRNLATLGYRDPDEVDLPDPGPRWWVAWTSVFVIGGLATAAALSHNPLLYLPLVPLAATGPWLAAVDFDVLRLPDRVVAPTAAATLLSLVGIAAATQDWSTLVGPAVATLATGAVSAAVHFATRSGIGFGDVKLAAVISLALGPLGIGVVWLSFLIGSTAALVWAKATRRMGPVPFGPWLLTGACLCIPILVAVR